MRTDPAMHPLEMILLECAQADPDPWYPSAYVQRTGTSRDKLDPDLEQLRMAGLIHLTDWVQGSGQGYALTPEGLKIVQNPRLLAQLRTGRLPLRSIQPLPAQAEMEPVPGWERGRAALEALENPSTPICTYLLILANVGVFLAGMALAQRDHIPLNRFLAGESPRILQQTGAVNGDDIFFRHQWWRLLSSCFVHIGLLHLGVNMVSLYLVGPLLEQVWGRFRYLILYLLSGLAGSCFGLMETRGLLAGASGALWGLLASFATWIFFHRSVLPPDLIRFWRRQLLFVFILNVGITFGLAHISKGAHFGGGAMGLLAAVPLDYLRFGNRWQRLLALVALVALPTACLVVLDRSLNAAAPHTVEIQKAKELADFYIHYLPVIRSAEKDGRDAWIGKAQEVCREDPPREADEVRQASAALTKAQREMREAVEDLDQAEPYWSSDAEEWRKAERDYLAAYAQYLAGAEECLQKNQPWTDRDRKLLRQKEEEALKLRHYWQQHFVPPK